MITATAVWSTADWIEALEGLEAPGPLPRRLVLVPSPSAAAALRRRLINRRRPELLLGTEITTVAELIARAGTPPPMSPAVRRVAIRRLAGEVELEALDRRAIEIGGLDAAVAEAIAELEAADLIAEALLDSVSPLVRDLARLWWRLGTGDGRYDDAVDALAARRDVDASLAVVTGAESAGEARVIRSLPNLTLAVIAARPDHRERIADLFGAPAAAALDRPPRPRSFGDESQLLASYIFDDPGRIAGSRPPSPGPDGSVKLEIYRTAAEEIDAAVDWVARQLLEGGVGVDEIALVVPEGQDRTSARLASALARLPWRGAAPVEVAGGVPLMTTAEGARLCGWLRDRATASGPTALVEAALQEVEISGPVATHLRAAAAELAALELDGFEAVAAVVEVIEAARRRRPSSGPAIFLGTAGQALGIDFAAIRFVGLGETGPATAIDLLAAAGLESAGLRTANQRRSDEHRAIAAITRGARHVAFSASGGPGPVMRAASRAVGRRWDRGEGDGWAEATPLTESMWLRRVAAGRISAPASWRRGDAVDPQAIRALASNTKDRS